jgi:hypothetical protein
MSRLVYPYTSLESAKLRWVPLSKLKPPHWVPKSECLNLIEAMDEDGWSHRPLLGFKYRDKIQCITGSHRIKAARYSNLQGAPVYIFSDELLSGLKKRGLRMATYCEFFYEGDNWAGCPGFAPISRLLAIDFRDKIWTKR